MSSSLHLTGSAAQGCDCSSAVCVHSLVFALVNPFQTCDLDWSTGLPEAGCEARNFNISW
jgi:hypothetical protein